MKKENKQKGRSRSYQRLREEEREELIVFLNKVVNSKKISTISREVKITYRNVKA
jgi:hypothetical protein